MCQESCLLRDLRYILWKVRVQEGCFIEEYIQRAEKSVGEGKRRANI